MLVKQTTKPDLLRQPYMRSVVTFALTLVLIVGLSLSGSAQIRIGDTDAPLIDISYTQPKTYEIGGIAVTGVKFLDPNALINMAGLRIGDEIRIPSETISNAVRKLWETNILGDVQINVTRVEGKLVFLELNLKERPRLSGFQFKGVSKGERDDLREKINLVRGRQVTDALISQVKTSIRKFFVEKGFLNTTVNIKQDDDSSTRGSTVQLRIEVDKKERVKVNDIRFEGLRAYDELTLRRKMEETKERRWYRLFKVSKFIKANYEKDKKAILEFYNKEGYRDAEIVSDSVYAHDGKSVNITMKVDEGNKYYFRNINWVGNYLYDSKTLSSILGVNRGDVYNMETLERRLQYNPTGADISSLYMDDGYLFFSVDPVEVNVENDSIDIEMRVYEGSQAIINKVNISGNTKTNDHVILREIRTLPGQKFSRADLIRTQRELAQLGYFDPEQIGIQPVPDPNKGTVDINYTVVERPSDQIELSGGWGGFFGFVGTVGLTFNNFSLRKMGHFRNWSPLPSGDGQRVSLRVQANGPVFQTYSFSFTEPWLGGKRPQSLTVSISHSVQNSFAARTTSFLRMTSASASLGRRLKWPDDYFTIINSLNVQHYTLNNFLIYGNQQDGFQNGNSTAISLNTTISRNSVNNPTFPTNGSTISLSVSATPPYSLFRANNKFSNFNDRFALIEYHKWMFDASWFTPLAKNLVLSTRTHLGFLGSYNDDLGIGPFERFKLGGSGLSGFNFILGYDVISQRGYKDSQVLTNGNPNDGGIVYNKYVTELRYAISTNPAATIFGLAFFEAGNAWANYRDYSPFNVYRSVGIGARIFMPAFGMLGLDMGFPFDEVPTYLNPSRQPEFHFTIGQQIR